MTEALTIAHLSDAHLSLHGGFRAGELIGKRAFSALNWMRKRRRMHLRAVVDALTADIAAHRPDLIAMTGDAVNFGLPREFDGAADWLSSLGAPADVSFVPGNHEAIMPGQDGAMLSSFAPFVTGDDGRAGFPWLRRRGPVALIGLSSSIATPPFRATGALGPAQIARLEEMLEETAGLARVILIHHPPAGPVKSRKRLLDAPALSAALARHGAELILHGHNHRSQISVTGGPARVPALGVPSASVGAGWHDDPAEWRRITLTPAPEGGHAIDILIRRIGPDLRLADHGRFRLIAPPPAG